MSASLVGSEMCIRDRRCRRAVAALSPRCRRDVAATLPRRCRFVAVLLPVSYTHLTLPTICSV
eukprot:10684252-Alexandrium_andersonii.AAC.1